MKVFAQRLRQARRKAKLSQDELAQRIGASRSSVARWERGNDVPSARTVWAMATELEVAARWLLGMRESGERPEWPSDDERRLLAAYRALGPTGKQVLLETALDALEADKAGHRHAKAKG